MKCGHCRTPPIVNTAHTPGYRASRLRNAGLTMSIKTHRDLEVWQKSIDLCVAAYGWTRSFPSEERFGLTSQIRRAAASVSCNIAEGAGRGTARDFLRFLHIARGSLAELETQLEIAQRCGIAGSCEDIQRLSRTVGRMLNGLIRALAH